MKKIIIVALSVVLLTGISTSSAFAAQHAHEQSNVIVSQVGLEWSNSIYVGISSNTNGCLYGGVYFSDDNKKSIALSVGTAALLANKKIRISYLQDDVSGVCTGAGIWIQP
jgi:hypothetical protein